jgi:hypothetical protein
MRTLIRMRSARETVMQWPWPGRILAACVGCVLLLSGCGSQGSQPPLTTETYQKQISCSPAPNPPLGVPRWNSPIGFSRGMFYNQSDEPLTVESVSLLDAHNLVLHQAVVYDMIRSQNPLSPEWGWNSSAGHGPAAQWAARQRVPGAVIPAEDGRLSISALDAKKPDLYEIAVDLSDASSAGGWALGEVVKYRAGGTTYTLTFLVGMAIGAASQPIGSACNAPIYKIEAAWHIPLGD